MTGRLLAVVLSALALLQVGAVSDLVDAAPETAGRIAWVLPAPSPARTAAAPAAAAGTSTSPPAGRPSAAAATGAPRPAATTPAARTAPASAPARRSTVWGTTAGATAAPASATAAKPAAAKPAAARPSAKPAAKPAARPAAAAAAAKPKPAKPAAKPRAQRVVAAPGPRADGCDGAPGWRERRAARAVAAVRMAPRDVGYALVVEPARRGLLGETFRSTRRVVLHVRECVVQSDADLAWVLAHELAHAVDFACGTGASRAAWLQARRPSAAYWPGAGARDDLASGAGDFAEVFALALTGHRAMWASRLAPAPDAAELQRLAPLLARRC